MVTRPNPTPSHLGTNVNPIAGALGLAAAGVAIWALVCAAGMSLSALSLTFAALFGNADPIVLNNLVLSGVAGVFAGVAVVAMRSFTRKPNHLAESFLSAIFNKGLAAPRLDEVFWGRALLGGSIGFAVGAVNGGSGIISFLHPFSNDTPAVFQTGTFPIVLFLSGGFGGPGGTDFLDLLFLVLVVILAAALVGFFAGLILHALTYGLAGMTKGGTKAYVVRVLQGEQRDPQHADKKPHPIAAGMINGLITGLLVGVIESAFTVWGDYDLLPFATSVETPATTHAPFAYPQHSLPLCERRMIHPHRWRRECCLGGLTKIGLTAIAIVQVDRCLRSASISM